MTELSPSDLQALYEKDPLKMTKEDIREIIRDQRRRREELAKEGKPAKMKVEKKRIDLSTLEL